MRKILSVGMAVLMVCVSFSMVSIYSGGEDITGPFAARNDGYPLFVVGEDQVQDDATYNIQITSTFWVFQTFRPSVTGNLNRASLHVSGSTGTGNVHVCLYDTDQGGNLGAQIASTTIDVFTDGWQDVFFTPEPALNQGVEYALKLSADGTKEVHWHDGDADNYPSGQMFYSDNGGASYTPPTPSTDMSFKTYMEYNVGGVRKVAWHPSGNFALGVTGEDSAVWEYYRELGSWSLAIANNGQVWNDIVYEPVSDRFYAVGHDGGAPSYPVAWEINPYDQPMNRTSLGSPPLTQGSFMGVCVASEGIGTYAFLAVGQNASMPGILACWYQMGTGWKSANGGDAVTSDGHILYDVAWDRQTGGKYYAVGADGSIGRIYNFVSAGDLAPSRISDAWASRDAHYTIEWQPPSAGAQYALIGSAANMYGNGNIQKFNGSTPVKIMAGSETIFDISWHPDGSYAIIVGQNEAGTGGIAYRHMAGEAGAIPLSHMLPLGTGPLYGVAVKGPSSPSSAIITGTSGSVGFYPSAIDQNTRLTTNVVLPQLRWIGFNSTTKGTVRMDQVDVEDWYYFTLFGNYSEGWTNCRVDVEAWYDQGKIGTASSYPAETNASRNLAFKLSYVVATGNYSCISMNNNTEINIGGFFDNNNLDNVPDQENHTVGLEIFLGKQIRAASGMGTSYGRDPNTGLTNPFSWDFCIKLSDARVYPLTQVNMSYGEFGVKQTVSISASGNPSGSGPSGASNLPMTSSFIEYSSNSNYTVDVAIPTIYLNGDTNSPHSISAGSFMVQNFGSFANSTNSQMWNPMTPIPGPNSPIRVWGSSTTPVIPIGNGTTSNGPLISNFNNETMGASPFTEVKWWVNIPSGIPEGAYWGTILATIVYFN